MGQYRKFIKNRFTDLGTPCSYMINKTGNNSVKGTLVAAHNSVDNAFRIPVTPYDIVGVVYDNGIQDGGLCRVVFAGVVEVLMQNSNAVGNAHWIRASSDAYGRALASTDPAGLGALSVDDHLKEIGHSLQTKSGGTNVLCKIVFHPL